MFYQKVLRPILFKTDPEKIHHLVIAGLAIASNIKPIYKAVRKFLNVNDPILSTKIGRVILKNPIGLAAGFDKNISAPLAYSMLGFGHEELGSITFSEQAGNPKPRLWRIPKDKGLIVYYGLANCGVDKVVEKLKKINNHPIPFGVSIAPTTGLLLNQMADDYVSSFEKLVSFADYITLNVSCPNVANCDMFAQVSFIKELIEKVNILKNKLNSTIDIFVKIGPDMTLDQYDEIVNICIQNNITAIISTNLVKNRSSIVPISSMEELNHPGGISGKLVGDKNLEIIKYLYRRANGKVKIIGVGGIFSAEDAYKKIKAGASALQLITGFIYGGPMTIKKINEGLIDLIKKDGYKNISEAVGKEV
jgi:dihydroorotate dehydrogenase